MGFESFDLQSEFDWNVTKNWCKFVIKTFIQTIFMKVFGIKMPLVNPFLDNQVSWL